jgi:hypothetical protein
MSKALNKSKVVEMEVKTPKKSKDVEDDVKTPKAKKEKEVKTPKKTKESVKEDEDEEEVEVKTPKGKSKVEKKTPKKTKADKQKEVFDGLKELVLKIVRECSMNDADFNTLWDEKLDDIKKIVKTIEKKSAKKVKDPNAPKKASSAYIFFGKDERPKIKSENEDMSGVEIMREIARRWEDVKGTSKAKKYEKLAEKDKARAKKEKDEFTPTPGFEKKEKKRATSAMTLWRRENKEKLTKKLGLDKLEGKSKIGEIQKRVSAEWKSLSDSKKKKYVEEAEKLKKEMKTPKKQDKKVESDDEKEDESVEDESVEDESEVNAAE